MEDLLELLVFGMTKKVEKIHISTTGGRGFQISGAAMLNRLT